MDVPHVQSCFPISISLLVLHLTLCSINNISTMNTAMKNIFAIATMLAAMCVTTAPEDFVAPFAAIRGSMVDNAPIGDSMETPVSINLRFPSFHQVNVEYPYATSKAKGLQASNDNVKVRGVCHVLVILQMYDCTGFQFRSDSDYGIPIPISTQHNHTF